MNKTFIKTSVLASLMLAAAAAMAAAPSHDLAVKGKIAVPGCTVAQTENGVYDYGTIDPGMIKSGTTTTDLETKTQIWTVTCDAPTFLSFQVDDNEPTASAPSNTHFGLGNVNGTGKIGYYTVTLSNAHVDGGTAYVYSATPGSGTVTGANTATVNSIQTQGWANTNTAGAVQKPGQVFAVDMTVKPTLAGSSTMNGAITTNVPVNGSLTINYAFGL